jgi:uncharacterized protein YjiS (DUF1127 family)
MSEQALARRERPAHERARLSRGIRRLLQAMHDRLTVENELARMDDREIADLGVTRNELHALTRPGNRSAKLLKGMTERLGVTAAMLEHAPELRRDIQRVCTTCDAQGRCRRWLRHPSSAEAYRKFCPNAGAFALLKGRQLGAG